MARNQSVQMTPKSRALCCLRRRLHSDQDPGVSSRRSLGFAREPADVVAGRVALARFRRTVSHCQRTSPFLIIFCVLISTLSCGLPEVDPGRRSPAMIVLGGAQDVSYRAFSFDGNETISYSLSATPPASDEVGAIRTALVAANWSELEDPEQNPWTPVLRRGSDGSERELECSRRTWQKDDELVTYSLCARRDGSNVLEISGWRRPIKD